MISHKTVTEGLQELLAKKQQERSRLNAEIDHIQQTLELVKEDEIGTPVKSEG